MWVDTHLRTYQNLHGSSRTVEESGILFKIEKAAESSGGDLTWHVFSLEDAANHLPVSKTIGILIIEN